MIPKINIPLPAGFITLHVLASSVPTSKSFYASPPLPIPQGLVYAMILSSAGGLELENTYPYLGQDAYCTEKKTSDNIAIKGLGYVKPWSQDALKSALYFKGPVSVSIDANPPAFRFYTGGVYKVREEEEMEDSATLLGLSGLLDLL